MDYIKTINNKTIKFNECSVPDLIRFGNYFKYRIMRSKTGYDTYGNSLHVLLYKLEKELYGRDFKKCKTCNEMERIYENKD